MIKFIHRNKQFIGVVFLFIAACFAISGVGLDILHSGPNANSGAATVNGQTLSVEELARSEQSIESRYRQMFGEQFSRLASSLNLNIRQQAIDSLIDRTILDQEAARHGYAASDEAVQKYILTTIFKGTDQQNTFSTDAYRNLLQSIGMSAPQFEREVKGEIARSTLVNLIRDAAVVTSKDAEAMLKKQKTTYTVVAATISQADVRASIPAPSESDLKKFYESNATDYEKPAEVAYAYHVLQPKDFEKDVQITASDVEFYYSENQAQFQTPEQARVRMIKLLYPKEADTAKMAAVREKAESARKEALAGKKFEDLVNQYSDDLPTKMIGGDLGWVKKGDKEDSFDQAVTSTAPGAISELIETDYGFEILKIEEKKTSQLRPLEEVKADIERDIKSREAPAYAANRGRELLLEAKKTGKGLVDLLPAGTSLKDTGGLLSQSKDPEPTLKGLTQNVFTIPTMERSQPALFEIGELTVLVQIKDFREPLTPKFEDIKEKVTADFLSRESLKVAEVRANELVKAVQGKAAAFATEASSRSAKVVGPFELSRESGAPEKFPGLTPPMRNAIFNAEASQQVLPKVFPGQSDFTVLKIESIQAPNLADPKNVSELATYKAEASQALAQNMIGSALEILKSRAKIEIDPAFMGAR